MRSCQRSELKQELLKKRINEHSACRICDSVAREAAALASEVSDFAAESMRRCPGCDDSSSGVHIRHARETTEIVWSGTAWGGRQERHVYNIHRRHYDKLRLTYKTHCPADPDMKLLHTRLFCLCVRYHFYLSSRNQGE